MAKKAAARKSAAKKSAKSTTRKAAGARRAARPKKMKVEFKRLHKEMDAAIAILKARKPSSKRDDLILKLGLMRSFKLCPSGGMFVEL